MTINGSLNLTSGNISVPVTRSGASTTVLTLASAPTYANGLVVTTGSTFVKNDVLHLFSYTGSSSGSFSSVTLPTIAGGLEWNGGGTTIQPVSGAYTVNCDGSLLANLNNTTLSGVHGASVSATASPSGGSGSGYTYAWTGPNSFSYNGATLSLTLTSRSLAGTYNLTVTDGNGCTAAGSVVVTYTDTAPVAGPVSAPITPNTSTKVYFSTLTAASSDVDGDTLTVASVSPTTAGSQPLTLGADFVYVPAGTSAGDTFTYTVSDGFGGTSAAGTVTMTAGTATGQQDATIRTDGGSGIVLTFYGKPGLSYYIWRTASLTSPSWSDVTGSPFTADSNGMITTTDTGSGGAAYYELSTSSSGH
jgi:hypothetical protein